MNITATPEEARAIVKDAYIYGWPMSENYNTLDAYTLTPGPEYKAPFNEICNIPRVYTPEDKAVVSPNSDTPYSFVWADIRVDPLVITVPPVSERYFSFQLIDLYTFNFDYIGTRMEDEDGGDFVVLGPTFTGPDPQGFKRVIRCETDFFFAIGRTQLFDEEDLENVEAIQNQYIVKTLSAFNGTTPPPAAPVPNWPTPLRGEAGETPDVFTVINFMLQFCPTHPSEEAMMERFAKIGVGPGLPFDAAGLSAEMYAAFEAGISDAWRAFNVVSKQMSMGKVNMGDLFGTRNDLDGNYLYRFTGAKVGLYGNSKEEAFYPGYSVDDAGQALDGQYEYTITLPGPLPAEAFASITMYDSETQLLVDNPIDRYLVNTSMEDSFVYGNDGSVTFYIQSTTPGSALENNWLPAPAGPFYMIMRLYIPQEEVLNGTWTQPPAVRVAARTSRASSHTRPRDAELLHPVTEGRRR